MATGFGLMRVTAARGKMTLRPALKALPSLEVAVPYQLRLSAPAQTVEIDTGKDYQAAALHGSLVLDAKNPSVALRVRWVQPPIAGESRFAKLTVEAPGLATFTHVFDASGDIDDYVELPISEAK